MMDLKKNCVLIVLSLLLFSNSAFANLSLPKSVHRAVLKTQRELKKNDFKKAESILVSYIKKHEKKHYIIHFLLGNIYSRRSKNDKAFKQYEISTKLNGSYAPAFQNLGTALFKKKEYKRAGDCMLKVYKISGEKDYQTLYFGAVSYILAEKPLMAKKYLFFLTSGKAGPPKAEWLKACLKLSIRLLLYDKAEDLIKKLIVLEKDNYKLWRLITWFHLKREHYKKALTAFKIYAYLKPLKSESDIRLLGDLYSVIGLTGEAALHYEKLKKKNYNKIVESYIHASRKDKAKSTIDKALTEKPDAKLYFLKGVLHFEKFEYQKAWEAFEKCTSLNNKNGRAYLLKGYCAIMNKNYVEAKKALKIAVTFKTQKKQAIKLLSSII
ncbi:MAG: hypothetical protein GY714_10940 [Desulfobacterales bacterium]|nr:hypothetical protein [Desulfobacterales bacterium]MCP4164205.1 hypothetical protein [Deltaproteobacteria bacterium]